LPFFEPNLLGGHFIFQNQEVIQPIFKDLKKDFITKSGKNAWVNVLLRDGSNNCDK